MNDLLAHENRHLRHRLQGLQSLHRRTLAALDAFREQLIAVDIAAPIVDIAALLGKLDGIRAQLSGEGGAS